MAQSGNTQLHELDKIRQNATTEKQCILRTTTACFKHHPLEYFHSTKYFISTAELCPKTQKLWKQKAKKYRQEKDRENRQNIRKTECTFCAIDECKRGVNKVIKVAKHYEISTRENKLAECIDTLATTSSQQIWQKKTKRIWKVYFQL